MTKEIRMKNRVRIAKQNEIFKLAKKSSVVTNIYKNSLQIQINCRKHTKTVTDLIEKLKELCPYYHTDKDCKETTDYWFATFDEENNAEWDYGDFKVVVVVNN